MESRAQLSPDCFSYLQLRLIGTVSEVVSLPVYSRGHNSGVLILLVAWVIPKRTPGGQEMFYSEESFLFPAIQSVATYDIAIG